jgi:hypothetical protein
LIRTTTLEETNRARCALSASSFGCATALDLDSYVQRIPSSGAHGVTTNENDKAVYGDCPMTNLTIQYAP